MKKALLVICSLFALNASSQDIGITAVNSPISGCNLGCVAANIVVYNYTPNTPVSGSIWMGTYECCYSVNGGPQVCEVFSTPVLGSGATFYYTFLDSICFTNQGTYTIVFTVDIVTPYPSPPYNGPDVNPSNNSATITVINDTTVVPGIISGPDSVCLTSNNGILTLSGFTGYPGNWEASVNGGPWTNEGDSASLTHAFSNITQPTVFRVVQDGGFCPDNYSQWATIVPVAPPVGGTSIGNATVCATSNTGTINLSGHSGTVTQWGYSNDPTSPLPWPPYSGAAGSTMTFTNLTTDTWFYANVSNGGYCADATSSLVHISVTPVSNAGTISSNSTVCSGDGDTLVLIGAVGDKTNILWVINNGITFNAFDDTTLVNNNITSTTQYYAVVTSGVCPPDTSAIATITAMPLPSVFAGNDTTISLGNTLCFNATGASMYNWSPSALLVNANLPNACFTPAAPGTYTFTVEGQDAFGCSNTDLVIVRVDDTVTIFPPVVCNFVTPNGDGLNDVWNIMNIEQYPDNEVTVYNNHGQPVFSASSYVNNWKGTYNGAQLPDGAYYYVVKINTTDRVFRGVLNITDTRF